MDKKKQWYQENKERIKAKQKERYELKKESIKQTQKEYYEKNKKVLVEKQKKYAKTNEQKIKDYQKEYSKEYRQKNKIELLDKAKKYNKEKRKNDPLFRLKAITRTYLSTTLKEHNIKKVSSTEFMLGCSMEFYFNYIESLFEPWMNWENYGNWNGIPRELNVAWDIDHIIPLSTAKNVDELIKLFHYTNTKPLCGYTNRFIKRGGN